jgi:hypothetical protein
MLYYYYMILLLDLAALEMSMTCLIASRCYQRDKREHPEAYL